MDVPGLEAYCHGDDVTFDGYFVWSTQDDGSNAIKFAFGMHTGEFVRAVEGTS